MMNIEYSRQAVKLLEIARRFVADDYATATDIEDINIAREEYQNNNTVNHNDIDW